MHVGNLLHAVSLLYSDTTMPWQHIEQLTVLKSGSWCVVPYASTRILHA